jgi:hypothetical protein
LASRNPILGRDRDTQASDFEASAHKISGRTAQVDLAEEGHRLSQISTSPVSDDRAYTISKSEVEIPAGSKSADLFFFRSCNLGNHSTDR